MTSSRAFALGANALLAAVVVFVPGFVLADEGASVPAPAEKGALTPPLSRGERETPQLAPVVVPLPPPESDEPAPESPQRRDPTGAVTIIDARERRNEAQVASDVIASAPGVLAQDRGGLLQSKTLSLRGASSNGVLVLLDGVPLNGSGGSVDLARVPLAIVERFEVLRGGGTTYGSGAMGGVVNVVTRAPKDGGGAVSGTVTYGSFNTALADLSATGALLGGAGLVIVHGEHSDGNFTYARDLTPLESSDALTTETRVNNDVSSGGALLRYKRALNDRTSFDGMAELSLDDRGLAGDAQNPTPDVRMRGQRALASAAVTRTFDGGGELRIRANARRELDAFDSFLKTPGQTWWTGGVEADGRMLVHDVHALSARAEVGADQIHGERLLPHTFLRANLSAQDEVLLRDGDLSIVPSVRLDRTGPFTTFEPKLGASAALPAGFTLRANVGQAHRAPSFDELYVYTPGLFPNPNLQPERALFADGTVQHETKLSRVALTGFYSLYENLITYERSSVVGSSPYNISTALVTGAEAEASFTPSNLLRATASYTLTFSQNLRDDPRYYLNELPYRPRHRVSARVSGGPEWLTGRVELDAQSEQFVNRTATTTLPARAFLNVGATGRVWKRPDIRLSLDVKNVLNTLSWDYVGYPLPGRAAYLTLSFSMDRTNGDADS